MSELACQPSRSRWIRMVPMVSAILTLLVLALALFAILSRYKTGLISGLRVEIGDLLAPHCNSMGLAVANHLSLLNGLKAFVEMEDYEAGTEMERTFPLFAAVLCEDVRGLRDVAIAPGGVQQYVYPLPGNKNVVGLNLLNDKRPGVRDSIERALATGKVTMAGPYELVGGGRGFVGRLALSRNERFWGTVSISIELMPLLKESGFDNLPKQFKFAIRRFDGEVFFGQSSVFDNSPVVQRIECFGEFLEIGAHPAVGWDAAIRNSLLPVQTTGVVLVLLLSGFAYLLASRHVNLTLQVKKRTRELAASEETFRVLVDAAPLAISSLTSSGKVKSWNTAAEKMFGWTAGEVAGKRLPIVPPEFQWEFDEMLSLVNAGESLSGLERVRRRKDDSEISICLWAAPCRNATGQIEGTMTVIEDITERKLAERKLSESSTRLKILNAISRDWLSGATIDTIIGRAVEEIGSSFRFYYAVYSEVDSRNDTKVLNSFSPPKMPDFRDVDTCLIDMVGKNGERCVLEFPVKHLEYPVGILSLVSTVPRRWSEHEAATLQEVSEHLSIMMTETLARKERAEIEAQLFQAQKIDSIGRLAGGIAHDFNNLLFPIIAYSNMLLEETGLDHPFHSWLQDINEAGEKAKKLTSQLLVFGRKQVLNVTVMDLNAVIAGFRGMLQRLIGEEIRVEVTLAPEVEGIRADAAQIEQVLLNLAINARDAMPGGGSLLIETREMVLTDKYVRVKAGMPSGKYVMLAVSDTGCGMDEETRKRIFEPFFTTKAKGKGTGLGLATVHGIVTQHGGHLSVYSEPGRGTTFKMYFPCVEKTARDESEPEAAPVLYSGTETVMVVEDDERVQAVAVSFLARCGYRVLAASRPPDAVRIVREHIGTIHMVLTDVIMPGMNGRDLYRTLKAIRPSLKVLFMSGYTNDIIGQHGILDHDTQFISKPFAIEGLSRKVRETLDV